MSRSVVNRSGALSVLAAGFILSAVLRTGDVVAALPETLDDGFGNAVVSGPDGAGEATGSDRARTLVEELHRQRSLLAERAGALDRREAELREVRSRLEARLEELDRKRAELAEMLHLADAGAERDVEHLAEMYQQMKPKQAAEIFDEMEPTFAAGFLGRIRSDAAALILANMQAERAYAVSLLIAGRNAGTGVLASGPAAD